jgi:hypothetical protein
MFHQIFHISVSGEHPFMSANTSYLPASLSSSSKSSWCEQSRRHWWLMPVGVLLWYPLHYYIYIWLYMYIFTLILYIYHYISTELQYWELAPMNSVSPWNQQVFFPTPIHYKHLTATFRRPNFSGWIILWPQKDPKISNLEAFFVFIVFDV